ncbi:unnamed protein product [Choristocarpus tenellus]
MVTKMRGKFNGSDLPQIKTTEIYGFNARQDFSSAQRRVPRVALLLVLMILMGSFMAINELLLVDSDGDAMNVRPPLQGETFTVRMNTWRRNDLLQKSATHFASCPFVHKVQIVWSDQENSPPRMDFFDAGVRSKIEFEIHDTSSLSHRFHAIEPIETDGVFSVDDDVIVPCGDLWFAFETWVSSSATMVGFHPRLVTYDKHSTAYSYKPSRFVFWTGIYNSVLTKCSFLHKDHLAAYSDMVTQPVLDYIDEHRNCEDIAMSFVVAQKWKVPPIWVSGKVVEIGSKGISSFHDHFKARSKCVDFFEEAFGDMPLIRTNGKVVQVSSGLWAWIWGI